MVASAGGRFVKKLVPGMRKHGQYRGDGSLEVTASGIKIVGKHVYSLGQRWGFGLVLAVGVTVLTLGTLGPAIPLVYLVVEYLWLAKSDQLVTFDRVKAYNAIPEKQLIAIEFVGTPWETPVVLRTPDWQAIYDALWAHVPRALVRDPTHLS